MSILRILARATVGERMGMPPNAHMVKDDIEADGWTRPTGPRPAFHLFSETHLRVASQRS